MSGAQDKAKHGICEIDGLDKGLAFQRSDFGGGQASPGRGGVGSFPSGPALRASRQWAALSLRVYPPPVGCAILPKRPLLKSSMAWRISASLFITKGP